MLLRSTSCWESNFPCDYFMLQFYRFFCALWILIWNWNSPFGISGGRGQGGRMCRNAFLFKHESSTLLNALVLEKENLLEWPGCNSTSQSSFISLLPALTCSNIILSAEAKGVTTVLLSAFQLQSPLASQHRGFPRQGTAQSDNAMPQLQPLHLLFPPLLPIPWLF